MPPSSLLLLKTRTICLPRDKSHGEELALAVWFTFPHAKSMSEKTLAN